LTANLQASFGTGGFDLDASISGLAGQLGLPQREKMDSPLSFFHGRVIAVTGGYIGDAPPYQGHVAILDGASGRLLPRRRIAPPADRVGDDDHEPGTVGRAENLVHDRRPAGDASAAVGLTGLQASIQPVRPPKTRASKRCSTLHPPSCADAAPKRCSVVPQVSSSLIQLLARADGRGVDLARDRASADSS
jgi:hypothetical protein